MASGHSNKDENVCISEYIEPVYIYNPGEYGLLRTVQQAWLIAFLWANALPTRVKVVTWQIQKEEGNSVFWEMPSSPVVTLWPSQQQMFWGVKGGPPESSPRPVCGACAAPSPRLKLAWATPTFKCKLILSVCATPQ